MKIYNKGDNVKFKTDHGSTLEGTVYDSTTEAVIVSTIFGTYSINRDQILSGGTYLGSCSTKRVDNEYDLGWWDVYKDEDEDGY